MYMNLKPNKHKRITNMASLGFIAPPPKILSPPLNLIFCSVPPPPPPQLFWSEIFRSPPNIYMYIYCMICLYSLNAGGKGWTQSPTVTFLFFSFHFHTFEAYYQKYIFTYLLNDLFASFLSLFISLTELKNIH